MDLRPMSPGFLLPSFYRTGTQRVYGHWPTGYSRPFNEVLLLKK